MPLGSVIGSNKGLRTREFLEIIIEQSKVPVVVDAELVHLLMRQKPWKWEPMPC